MSPPATWNATHESSHPISNTKNNTRNMKSRNTQPPSLSVVFTCPLNCTIHVAQAKECAVEVFCVDFGDAQADGGGDFVESLAAVVPERGKESLHVHLDGIDLLGHSPSVSRRRSASRASKRSSSFFVRSPSLR